MHPDRKELIKLATGTLPIPQLQILQQHISSCEFCKELLAELRDALDVPVTVDLGFDATMTNRAGEVLFRRSIRPDPIQLRWMPSAEPGGTVVLAADGHTKAEPSVKTLATYFCEDPELVLQYIRDDFRDETFLQLVADDPSAVSNVLLRPSVGDEFYLTDQFGRAEIVTSPDCPFPDLKWSVKSVDVTFELSVLQETGGDEIAREAVLETPARDRIRVRLTGNGENRQLQIEILELDGKADFGRILVNLSNTASGESRLSDRVSQILFPYSAGDPPIMLKLYCL